MKSIGYGIKVICKFIRKVFFTVMGFFGLIDEHRNLSRTNIILYIATYRFATIPLEVASIQQLIAAIIALTGLGGAAGLYAFKKSLTSKAGEITADVINKIKDTVSTDDTKE